MTEKKQPYRIEGREPTIFRVIKDKNNPYVMIDRRPIYNPELSYKAKGILVYLLSRPDGWEVNVPDLVAHSTDGASSVRAGLKELRKARHVAYNPKREGGYIKKWVIEVYEVPDQNPSQCDANTPLAQAAEQSLDSDFDNVGILDSDFLNQGNLKEEKLNQENRRQLNKESKVNKDSIKKREGRAKNARQASGQMPERFPSKFESLAQTFIRETGLKCETKQDYDFWCWGNKASRQRGFESYLLNEITSNDIKQAMKGIRLNNKAHPNNPITLKAPNSLFAFAFAAKQIRVGRVPQTQTGEPDQELIDILNGGVSQ